MKTRRELARVFLRFFVVGIGSLLLTQSLWAATSASINGTINSSDGSAIEDATITILHVPSGTTSTAISGTNGSFYQSGLRIGGPYTIRIVADGYAPADLENIQLREGLQAAPSIELQSASEMEEMVVTATQPGSELLLNNGLGSTYSSEDIANQPSGQRDVLRTLLQDPLAHTDGEGQLSVAGINPRFNGFAIDGSRQQDDFGLSDNTYATSRSPINLDAIESVSLAASDYSVTASGFTGGLVNITTKSGENEWDGSLFYYFHNEGYIGETYDGDRSYNPGPFDEKEYGFTAGGPIIKDQLFVFLSIDEYETSETVDFSQYDSSNGISPGFFEALRQVVRDTYGWDPGGRPSVAATPSTSERTLVKVDWNVNESHRVALTHQITQETGTSASASRLESNWIDFPVDLTSTTVQLFSDWSNRVSSTFRINNKDFVRGQNCRAGMGVAAFEMDNIRGSDLVGTPLEGLLTGEVDIDAGCDRFRQANEYEDERLQISGVVDYLIQDHVLRFGVEYEYFDLYNLFVPGSAGRYVFNGYYDLIAREARVDYVNTITNNARDGAATWSVSTRTFFVQNNWSPIPDVEVSAGIRWESHIQDDRPYMSQEVLNQYGVRTDNNLDGLSSWLPRASVRWDVQSNTIVTAGLGLFSGGDPKVWTSNAFQVPTVFKRLYNAQNVSPTSVPSVLREQVAAESRGTPIDFIADDFEIPSDWKLSLRLDHTFDFALGGLDLGSDYTFVAQYLHTRAKNGFLWTNLSHTELNEALPTGTAPDGRIIYADLDSLDIINLTQLGNFSGGSSHILTFGLAKGFENGLDVNMNYAWQDVQIITEGFSSRGISNWRNIYDENRNNPSAKDSPYEVEHAFKFRLGYERELFAGIRSRFDLMGRVYTGQRYSFTFNIGSTNSLFGRAGAGESPYDNSPIYIPTGANDSRVVYRSSFPVDDFMAYVSDNDIPSGIFDPFSEHAGWHQIFDFRMQVEIPGLDALKDYVGDNSVKLVLNIDNVLNFLNDEWGVFEYGPRYNQAAIVSADLISVQDMNENGVDGARALTRDAPRTTCRSASDCVYRFNRFNGISLEFPNGPRSVYQIRLGIRIDL